MVEGLVLKPPEIPGVVKVDSGTHVRAYNCACAVLRLIIRPTRKSKCHSTKSIFFEGGPKYWFRVDKLRSIRSETGGPNSSGLTFSGASLFVVLSIKYLPEIGVGESS